jgi:hypothetical protein
MNAIKLNHKVHSRYGGVETKDKNADGTLK